MKKAARHAFGLLLLTCFAASQAAAQDAGGDPANWCRNGAFARDAEEFRTARVTGRRGARAYFYGDEEGCPGPAAKCRQKSYVVPGDEVVVSRAFGDWLCAWYQPARGPETVGWLAADRLGVAESAAQKPRLAQWLGAWSFHDSLLRLTRSGRAGALRVEGSATWQGANPGNVHVGEVSGEAAPAGAVLRVGGGDDDCRLTLRLVGSYLIAADNKQCGGLNVTFDGVYRRRK